MKKNKNWFSVLIAMWLVLVSSYFAYTILEYIYPFSQNIKWIENSSKAYYQANNWIEQGLYFLSSREESSLSVSDSSKEDFTDSEPVDYKYTTLVSTWDWTNTYMPYEGVWNSETDEDYNIIQTWEPINLSIWYGVLDSFNNVNITFKVPTIETIDYTLAWTEDIINWKLSSVSDSLTSYSWSLITPDDINSKDDITLSLLEGKKLNWDLEDFKTFYDANCSNDLTDACTLRFSIINELASEAESALPSITIPYLEWRLDVWNYTNDLPLRYSTIESTWKSYGFSRDLEVRYSQDSVSEAFDFTVFQ